VIPSYRHTAPRNELNFQRFDAKLEQRFAQADVKREQQFAQADAQLAVLRDEIGTDLSDCHMSLLRWMFGFWIATLEPLGGLILALRAIPSRCDHRYTSLASWTRLQPLVVRLDRPWPRMSMAYAR
jgi:hypothetical protein